MTDAASGLHLCLDDEEVRVLTEIATDDAAAPPAHDWFRQAPVLAQELPLRLRRALWGMRQREDSAFVHITGLAVDDEAIGDTPSRWRDPAAQQRTQVHENQMALLGSLLGELFGWNSQQDGSVVHDVLPLREFENDQINFASKEPIWWHTEDAFHSHRPDYVGLMCMRNPQLAATTVSCASEWDLSDARFDLLFEERFQQRADQAHEGGGARQSTKPRAILTGERDRPFVCVDPYFLEPPMVSAVAEALEAFYAVVDRALRPVTLAPGDVLIVDNHRAVHGRKPFHARYDGRDRWLKRMSVSRELRRSWQVWTGQSRQVLDGSDH